MIRYAAMVAGAFVLDKGFSALHNVPVSIGGVIFAFLVIFAVYMGIVHGE